jgi:hypothetical protein
MAAEVAFLIELAQTGQTGQTARDQQNAGKKNKQAVKTGP